jgi:hypothetical protein
LAPLPLAPPPLARAAAGRPRGPPPTRAPTGHTRWRWSAPRGLDAADGVRREHRELPAAVAVANAAARRVRVEVWVRRQPRRAEVPPRAVAASVGRGAGR